VGVDEPPQAWVEHVAGSEGQVLGGGGDVEWAGGAFGEGVQQQGQGLGGGVRVGVGA
jgi:hypothetical protein